MYDLKGDWGLQWSATPSVRRSEMLKHASIVMGRPLLLHGCQRERHKFEFCAINRGVFDKESTIIDTDNHRVDGADTSFEFGILDLGFARGFAKPFPFMLPAVPLNKMPGRWEAGGYRFTMSVPPSADLDWVLTSAQPMDASSVQGFKQLPVILYSNGGWRDGDKDDCP